MAKKKNCAFTQLLLSQKSLVVFVLAILICDTAAGFTSRLTRSLTLSASTVFYTLL